MASTEAVKGASLIPGWYSPEQLRLLEMLALSTARQGDLMLEVGTWLGRSAYVLAYVAALQGARLVCVDTWKGLPRDPTDSRYEIATKTDLLAQTKRNLAWFEDNVSYLVGDSATVLPQLKGGDYALVHIDGDHTKPAVISDVSYGWYLLKPGGVLCGDDYDEQDVVDAVANLGVTPDVKGKLWWTVKPSDGP